MKFWKNIKLIVEFNDHPIPTLIQLVLIPICVFALIGWGIFSIVSKTAILEGLIATGIGMFLLMLGILEIYGFDDFLKDI